MTPEQEAKVKEIEKSLEDYKKNSASRNDGWVELNKIESSIRQKVCELLIPKELMDRIYALKGKYIRSVSEDCWEIIKVREITFDKERITLLGRGPRVVWNRNMVYQCNDLNLSLYCLKDHLNQIEVLEEKDIEELDRLIDDTAKKQIDAFTKVIEEQSEKTKNEIRKYLGDGECENYDERHLLSARICRHNDLLKEITDISMAGLLARIEDKPDPDMLCDVESDDDFPYTAEEE